jgi:hypothetical protein
MKARPPPRVKTPSVTIYLDVSDSQISSPDFFYVGPDDPTDSYRISKPHGVTPMVAISVMNLLFPTPERSEELISIYSPGIHDFCQ